MQTRTVTPSDVTLPLDKFPHIEFSVTLAAVTLHRCLMCGTTDLPPRAKTCGSNCRKAMSRRKETIARGLANVENALEYLGRLSDHWPDLQTEIAEALQKCVTTATVTYFDVAGRGEG